MTAIITVAERCGACNLCVLACSYHHVGSFGRRFSSIRIHKDEAEGDVEIAIAAAGDIGGPVCDACPDQEIPLCVSWCPTGALLTRENER
jgi:Fe-S-cluster-containing dehydrogenase component